MFIRQTAVAGLLLAALLFYLPPYSDSFLGDDYVQLDRVSELVAHPYRAYQVLNPFWDAWYYRPLQNLWFLSNRLIFGFTPFAYYYLQICVHMLAMAGVYRVARQFGLGRLTAVFSMALFGFHGHHFDVVSWLSSIAIVLTAVFSLFTMSAFLKHLAHPENERFLLLTTLFFWLTLLAHEEGFLLPPLLLFLWWIERRSRTPKTKGKGPQSLTPRLQPLIATFVVMALTLVGYLAIQFIRPNLNVTVSDTTAGHWLQLLDPNQISRFGVETVVRYTTLFNADALLQANAYVVTYLVLIGMAIWFWRGGRLVRFGLMWAALHLGFIYAVLWTQRPEFFAGRHLYNASIGLALALGAVLQNFIRWPVWGSQQTRRLLAGIVVALLLVAHVRTIHTLQAVWLNIAIEDKAVKSQMKQLLPQLSQETHIFANRFVIQPSYLPATVAVWYEQPLAQPSGSLERLKGHGQATHRFYLLDYANGQLVNLMPELQQHERTLFLWSQTPWVEVVAEDGGRISTLATGYDQTVAAGPQGDRRLALWTPLPDLDDGWLSLRYEISPPQGSELRVAIRRPSDINIDNQSTIAYRVVIEQSVGQRGMLFEQVWGAAETAAEGWQEVIIPLEAYWNQTVSVRLEVKAEAALFEDGAYWANPRLVID